MSLFNIHYGNGDINSDDDDEKQKINKSRPLKHGLDIYYKDFYDEDSKTSKELFDPDDDDESIFYMKLKEGEIKSIEEFNNGRCLN